MNESTQTPRTPREWLQVALERRLKHAALDAELPLHFQKQRDCDEWLAEVTRLRDLFATAPDDGALAAVLDEIAVAFAERPGDVVSREGKRNRDDYGFVALMAMAREFVAEFRTPPHQSKAAA